MAYIPTIHTFEDDINENRGFDELPISGGINNYNLNNDILVKEKGESSLTKKNFNFYSYTFYISFLSVVAYYFMENGKLLKKKLDLIEKQKLGRT